MAGKANPCGKTRPVEKHAAKHTPGPWIVRYAKNITAIGTTKGEMQLSLHGVYDGLKPLSVDVHEWQANANLIAAAPAMYEALKDSLVLLEASYHDMHDKFGAHDLGTLTVFDCVEKVKATLAQAEGKQ